MLSVLILLWSYGVQQIFRAKIRYSTNSRKALAGAELAILVTEWDEFRRIRPEEFRSLMKTPRVFDGRRIYNSDEMIQAGIVTLAVSGFSHLVLSPVSYS
jgi:UDP-N-acetyl-D-mannosaminuronate dehydrogenase